MTEKPLTHSLDDNIAESHTRILTSFISGLCIGTADAIPGISGSTIALILNVYTRIINSFNTLIHAPVQWFRNKPRSSLFPTFIFLVPLIIGVICAYYFVTKLLVGSSDSLGLLQRIDTAPIAYGFFFGLVASSIHIPWKRITQKTRRHQILALIGMTLTLIFVFLPISQTSTSNLWLILSSGIVATAFMLLPGISGSLFLVIVGQYQTIISAIHDQNLRIILAFSGGILVGFISIIPVLHRLLKRKHDDCMALLSGFIAGSLLSVWPWKNSYTSKISLFDNITFGEKIPHVLIACFLGFVTVSFLNAMKHRHRPLS